MSLYVEKSGACLIFKPSKCSCSFEYIHPFDTYFFSFHSWQCWIRITKCRPRCNETYYLPTHKDKNCCLYTQLMDFICVPYCTSMYTSVKKQKGVPKSLIEHSAWLDLCDALSVFQHAAHSKIWVIFVTGYSCQYSNNLLLRLYETRNTKYFYMCIRHRDNAKNKV